MNRNHEVSQMKHAYLIMAANEFEEILALLKALDYEDNAIFLHIDKKAALSPLQLERFKQRLSKADFYLAPRRKVSWGGRDMLECEFSLFSFARSVGPFDYYHLLSGKDLPLLSHKRINEFLKKTKAGNSSSTNRSKSRKSGKEFRSGMHFLTFRHIVRSKALR